MAGKLNARKVETLTEPGRYSDGGNLYLSITPNGGKRWVFAYRGAPKPGSKNNRYEMGLGSAGPTGVSLKDARDKAAEARRLLSEGKDPLTAKRQTEKAERTIPTFGAFADEYIATHKAKFRNDKHIAQWETTLGDDYCRAIRAKPVNEIDTEAVLAVLQPIWTKTPETASRLRGRIENILDAARAKEYRDGSNPATWRGHLKTLLPARQKLTRGHHAALPYDDLPAFMAALRSRQSLAARALELCVLTATRTSEVLAAEWTEFDLDKKVWTIPPPAHEGGPLPPHPAYGMGAGYPEVTAAHRPPRLPRQRQGQATVQHGDDNAAPPHEARGHHRARLPQHLQRLGLGTDIIPARDMRACAGPPHQRQGRGRLQAWRPVREAPEADGSLGSVV